MRGCWPTRQAGLNGGGSVPPTAGGGGASSSPRLRGIMFKGRRPLRWRNLGHTDRGVLVGLRRGRGQPDGRVPGDSARRVVVEKIGAPWQPRRRALGHRDGDVRPSRRGGSLSGVNQSEGRCGHRQRGPGRPHGWDSVTTSEGPRSPRREQLVHPDGRVMATLTGRTRSPRRRGPAIPTGRCWPPRRRGTGHVTRRWGPRRHDAGGLSRRRGGRAGRSPRLREIMSKGPWTPRRRALTHLDGWVGVEGGGTTAETYPVLRLRGGHGWGLRTKARPLFPFPTGARGGASQCILRSGPMAETRPSTTHPSRGPGERHDCDTILCLRPMVIAQRGLGLGL